MNPPAAPFKIIGASAVRAVLSEHASEIVPLVRATYLAHDAASTINPPSYFLRFPDQPTARIIALPARLKAENDVAGIKWISSFPSNLAAGLPRASAIVLLNDMKTGFPIACVEGSQISAARTGASAALAAEILHGGKSARQAAVIGAGPIAACIVHFLKVTGWRIGRILIHDTVAARAAAFAASMAASSEDAAPAENAEAAIRAADLVIFATTSPAPHLMDPDLFQSNQTVLHVSLRDLVPEIILSAQNIVDDVEHCLKAETSVHLTEQRVGNRGFIDGTIGDLIVGRVKPDRNRPRIFSPFGLGVLDIALAQFVYAEAREGAVSIEDFLFAS